MLTERATGTPLETFAQEALFTPLQIDSDLWITTPEGLPNVGGGLFLTGRDAAKLGQLMLQDGVWDGERLLPEGWMAASTTEHTLFSGSLTTLGRGYGYQLWLDDFTDEAGASLGIYSAQGFGGQAIYVWPEAELVVALAGSNWGAEAVTRNVPHEVMQDAVVPAVR